MSDRIRIMNAKGKMYFFGLLLAIVSLGRAGPAWAAQDASAHPTWPGPGQLFVGACYQTHILATGNRILRPIVQMSLACANAHRERRPKMAGPWATKLPCVSANANRRRILNRNSKLERRLAGNAGLSSRHVYDIDSSQFVRHPRRGLRRLHTHRRIPFRADL